jgi:hypothetical protein
VALPSSLLTLSFLQRIPGTTHAHQEFYGGRFSVHALENKTQKEKAWNSSIQDRIWATGQTFQVG